MPLQNNSEQKSAAIDCQRRFESNSNSAGRVRVPLAFDHIKPVPHGDIFGG